MLKIDMHTHIIPAKMPRFAEKFGYGDYIYLDHHTPGRARMMKGNEFFREICSNCWDPEERIREYERHHTQMQVVCTIPVLFGYDHKPTDGLEIARFLNDHVAQLMHDHPRHYLGLGTLPMQDPALAVQELQRCREIGLPGVQIGSNINDKNLSEPDFYPVFEACQELDMAVFVHPWNMMGFHSMRKYWLPWLVGMPAETARAICSFIFSGAYERWPRLRLCFAHAGGSFIPTIGRIQHGYDCRPDLVAVDNPNPPRNYLGKFWVDCITHDPALLRYIIDAIGPDKICLGSDYPFPMGDLEIGAFVREMDLPDDTVEAIYSRNTLEWLGVKKEALVA